MAGARRPVVAQPELVVVLSCEWCGREIRLVATEMGQEIEDRQAFLDVHGECLARLAARDA